MPTDIEIIIRVDGMLSDWATSNLIRNSARQDCTEQQYVTRIPDLFTLQSERWLSEHPATDTVQSSLGSNDRTLPD